MTLTAFTSRLGVGQGRIPEPGVASGNYVFVLGDSDRGHFAELTPGDYVQVTQTTELTGISLIRVNLELRVPKGVPDGLGWNASVLVDGNRLASTTARSGRSRAISDLCANVSKLSGTPAVAVRLELVAN